jgi:peptidoglycan hydrolase-like protein with peptidoglycan-binding domain
MKKVIKLGAKGIDVKKIQQLLAKAGSTIKPNGVFSIGMLSAVKAFQKRNNLKVTGVVDAATLKKLEAYNKPKRAKKA